MPVGRRYRLLSFAAIAAACVLLPYAPYAKPQDSQAQQSSVAEAARRAKHKKPSAKASKVIDDDNLSSNLKTGGPDVTNVGASAAATVNPGPGANTEGATTPETTTGDQTPSQQAQPGATKEDEQSSAEQDPEIAKLKGQVAQTEEELDLLKRGFTLDSETYYSKTDYSTDKAGKAKLDGEQQQIADKQQQLDGLKTQLAALQQQHGRHKSKPTAPTGNETEKPASPPQL